MSTAFPTGSFARMDKPALHALVDRLREAGYRVIGPAVSQGAAVYEELRPGADLSVGYTDDQEAGRYRLKKADSQSYFDYTVGPHSLKNFLFSPRTTVLETIRIKGDWRMPVPQPPRERTAMRRNSASTGSRPREA
jgi:hypothetical protein